MIKLIDIGIVKIVFFSALIDADSASDFDCAVQWM